MKEDPPPVSKDKESLLNSQPSNYNGDGPVVGHVEVLKKPGGALLYYCLAALWAPQVNNIITNPKSSFSAGATVTAIQLFFVVLMLLSANPSHSHRESLLHYLPSEPGKDGPASTLKIGHQNVCSLYSAGRSGDVNLMIDLVLSQNLDAFGITETWLDHHGILSLSRKAGIADHYRVYSSEEPRRDVPRRVNTGKGAALVLKSHLAFFFFK